MVLFIWVCEWFDKELPSKGKSYSLLVGKKVSNKDLEHLEIGLKNYRLC